MRNERINAAEMPGPNIDERVGKERAICFGSFRLLVGQHLLLKVNRPVRLGSRALEILIALVERAGDVVSKEELMARVWPNTFVDPANLAVHVSALRRVLGDGRDGNRFLINIPGRGYCFVAPIDMSKGLEPDPPRPAVAELRRVMSADANRVACHADVADEKPIQLRAERPISTDGPREGRKISAVLPLQQPNVCKTTLSPAAGDIELEFANGTRMRISGSVDAQMIWTMVTELMAKEVTPKVSAQQPKNSSNKKRASQSYSPAEHPSQQAAARYRYCDRRRRDLRLTRIHA